MQKFNSTGTYCDTLPRDVELQLRLADSGGAGDGKENGAGKHFLAKPEEENSLCTKRKMLVGLDVICLCIGKNKSILITLFFFAFEAIGKQFLWTLIKTANVKIRNFFWHLAFVLWSRTHLIISFTAKTGFWKSKPPKKVVVETKKKTCDKM